MQDSATLFDTTTRLCTICRVIRPLDMFYLDIERRRAVREGRSRLLMKCRVCQRATNNRTRKPKQDYADRIKLASGCTDCGIRSDHPEIYDFDHMPGTDKLASVSTLLTKGTMQNLMDEIAKCEVVCANCHRIRTRARVYATFGRSWSAGQ